MRDNLRKIEVLYNDKTHNYMGYFHQWITDLEGNALALVEKENGEIETYDYGYVRFVVEKAMKTYQCQHCGNKVKIGTKCTCEYKAVN